MDQRDDYADPARPVARWVYVGVCALLLGAILAACNLAGGFQLGPSPATIKGQAPPG